MISKKTKDIDNSSHTYEWHGFKENEAGEPVVTSAFTKLSAQVSGDLDPESFIKFEVSNNEIDWFDATDEHDRVIIIDQEGLFVLPIDALYIRPVLYGTSGDGVSINVYAKGKK